MGRKKKRAPRSDALVPTLLGLRARRSCLGPCGAMFWSASPANRICLACRRAADERRLGKAEDPVRLLVM